MAGRQPASASRGLIPAPPLLLSRSKGKMTPRFILCKHLNSERGGLYPFSSCWEDLEKELLPVSLPLPPSWSSFHGRSHSSDWSEPRTFTGPCSPWAASLCLGVRSLPPVYQASRWQLDRPVPASRGRPSADLSRFQYLQCNWVGEPSAPVISKSYNSSLLKTHRVPGHQVLI